jgi:LysR family transcriptional regulator, glycine cleavage system transcriptional activator
MTLQLPPLNPLRAFEAAARNMSILLAADEMNVTPSAVSHQIRVLERALAVDLFLRLHRKIQLTAVGERYYMAVSPLMRQLCNATDQISPRRAPHVLHICGYSTFTMRWLIPRLIHFHGRHPDIQVRVRTSMEDIDFSRSNFDGAIRSGQDGDWPGLRAIYLAPIRFVPVCSPRLLMGSAKIRTPEDLSRYVLLHSLARPDAWRRWLAHVSLKSIDPERGIMFDNSGLCYQAALEGLGVAIAQDALIQEELNSGSLIKLFDGALDEGEAYYFVTPKATRSRLLEPFEEWLRQTICDAHRYHHLNLRSDVEVQAAD